MVKSKLYDECFKRVEELMDEGQEDKIELLYLQALLFFNTQKYDEFNIMAEKVLELDPKFSKIRSLLGIYLR